MQEKEKQFIRYWEQFRDRENKLKHQLLFGVPVGLLFALPIVVILLTGRYWYERADMQAVAKLNPYVIVVAVFFITVFVAVFYKRYQWERKEQQYHELKAKEKRESAADQAVQH